MKQDSENLHLSDLYTNVGAFLGFSVGLIWGLVAILILYFLGYFG